MDYKKNRPLNINPLSIRLPLPALISITHRLSGIFVFLLIPLLLWALQLSLESQNSFDHLKHSLTSLPAQLTLGLFLAALLFHLIAGIRHLLMDLDIGDSLKGGKIGAGIVIILFIMMGAWIGGYIK